MSEETETGAATVGTSEIKAEDMKGAFASSLTRNNKKIRNDRAIAIADLAQTIYRREVEDVEMEIKGLRREREALLDLSPTTAESLILATDFDPKKYVQKDLEIGVRLRNLEIKLTIAKERYNFLFVN